jgi:hypothetical protein
MFREDRSSSQRRSAMKIITMFFALALIVMPIYPNAAHADDPIPMQQQVELPFIPQISITKTPCPLVPNQEIGDQLIVSGSIVMLTQHHSFNEGTAGGALTDMKDVKCLAKFKLESPQTCPEINVVVRNDYGESMCATLASALGSPTRNFNNLMLKETKQPLLYELVGFEWLEQKPKCECQTSESGSIQLTPKEGAIPEGLIERMR